MSMYSLLSGLAESAVDFVLVGGLAVTLHGYQRVTMDVHVVLALNNANLDKFIDNARRENLRPVLPIAIDSLRDAALIDQWHRDKGMLAFALRGPDMMATVIDVLVRPVVSFEQLKRNAVTKRIGPLSIAVASIDDLIRMKTATGRSKDALDIEELRKIKEPRNSRAMMQRVELTAEENLRLLREIEANRSFILLAYQSDPDLLRRADPEIRRLFESGDRQILLAGQEQASQPA